jgi:hypothetical protein
VYSFLSVGVLSWRSVQAAAFHSVCGHRRAPPPPLIPSLPMQVASTLSHASDAIALDRVMALFADRRSHTARDLGIHGAARQETHGGVTNTLGLASSDSSPIYVGLA